MRWTKTIQMIEAHAEGEVGRIVTSGVMDLPGTTMLDKMNYLNRVDDGLRRFLVFEPRGYAQMSTNLLFPPAHRDADAGFIVLQGDKAHAMSGSNAICLVTVLLETGLLEMKQPETVVTLDTPAGLVRATATCSDGKCERVSLDMNASFVERLDQEIEVEGVGTILVDIAYGGIFYGLIDVRQLGLEIIPENAKKLVEYGVAIHRAINQSLEINHPELDGLEGISYTMFTGFDSDGVMQGATILPPGRVDRSPCGTGNSARLAVMHARNQIEVGEKREAKSIIDSRFAVEIAGTTVVAGRAAVLPHISGRGWIHGMHQIGLDPTDPYPLGYKMSDCWGDAFDLLSDTDN